MCRLRCPPGKADTLKELKSVICAGAAHVWELDADREDGVSGGLTVTNSVTVDAGDETVTVIGASVRIYVAVTTSVAVSMITADGDAVGTGGPVVCGGIEKREGSDRHR